MDTLSHGFWTYYMVRHQPLRCSAAIGGVAPDSFMYVFAGNLWLTGKFTITKHWLPQLFSQPTMWTMDSIFHSVPIWLSMLILAILLKKDWCIWTAFGGLGHIAVDMATHKQYIDGFFMPIYTYTFPGFVDYHTPLFTAIDCTAIFFAVLYAYASKKFNPGKIWRRSFL